MPEKIEEILKAIHVLFSKCDSYNNSPDRIILSKRDMFDLLEKLNYAVVDVMDQYEATTRSKEKARLQMEKAGQDIIADASSKAEDVYAASMLYTDEALNDLYGIIKESREKLNDEYRIMEEKMSYQMQVIAENQKELMMQLNAMAQGKKYLDIIDDYNTAYIQEKDDELDAEQMTLGDIETEYISDEELMILNKKETRAAAVKKKEEKPIRKVESSVTELVAPLVEPLEKEEIKQKIEVKVHTGGGIPENSIFNTKAAPITKKDRKRQEKEEHDQAEIYQETDPDQVPERKGQVYSADDFNLDAEYEQWKVNQPEDEKSEPAKNKFFGFGKKK